MQDLVERLDEHLGKSPKRGDQSARYSRAYRFLPLRDVPPAVPKLQFIHMVVIDGRAIQDRSARIDGPAA